MTQSVSEVVDDTGSAPRALIYLLSLACGVVAANIYYVQPLVGELSRTFGMPETSSGALVTVTQLGYAAGLVLVVPLGDIVENRGLIVAMLALLLIAMAVAFVAPTAALFMAASAVIGLMSSAVQVMVPLAGHLASDATRGRVVGIVVSGLLLGIMLSRPAASFCAHLFGPRSIFAFSACVTAALAIVLATRLPRRRPHGMPYLRALASMKPLVLNTRALHRRSAYQAALFGCFSLFWTAVPLLLEGPRFNFSQFGIGVFALAGAGGAIISPFAGRAADAGFGRQVTLASLITGSVAFVIALAGGIWSSWVLLVVAGLALDMAAAANLVIGQREIFALGAEARGRLNGLYLALFFGGGALGSLVASIAYGHGGWTAVCLVGFVPPLFALAYSATEHTQGHAR